MAGRVRYRVRVTQAAYLADVSPSTIRRLYKGDPKAGKQPVLSVTRDKKQHVLIDLDELVAACPKLDEAEVRRRLAALRSGEAAIAPGRGKGRAQRGTLPRSRSALAEAEAARLRAALQQAEARADLAEQRARRSRRRARQAEAAAEKWEARFFDEHGAVIRLTERTNELQLVITEAIRARRLDPPPDSHLEAPRAAAAPTRAHDAVFDDHDEPPRPQKKRRRRPPRPRDSTAPKPTPTAADTLLSVAAGVVDRLTRGR